MLAIFNVIAPVFALIITGYLAVRFKLYPASGVAGLVAFVNNFATPCLLFQAMLNADFAATFNPAVLVGFYAGSVTSLFGGALVAVKLFSTRPGVGVAAGFSAMFTNTVLIGIPIAQRAFGEAAMPVVYSIIGFHAPLLLTLGMVTMELVRRDGRPLHAALAMAGRRIVTNPLLWAIGLGVLGNVAGLTLIEPAAAFVAMMAAAVLPTALFSLGGALNAYRLADNWSLALAMTGFKLVLHPVIAWVVMVPVLRVDPEIARYGVVLAAMPAGINAYVFATQYNRGVDVAASTILLTTMGSALTVSVWLLLVG